MSSSIDLFINRYTYWSEKYARSQHINDYYKKTIAFKELIKEVNNQGISKSRLALLIEQAHRNKPS